MSDENLPIIDSCEGCGACCLEQGSPPFLGPDDPELAALPPFVLASYRTGMAGRADAGWNDGVPCFWLDLNSRRCTHYEHRPAICREALERGDVACQSWRATFDIE